MSTFTVRVTSSATNPGGTVYGQQPDLGAPSYWDVYISNSTDPLLPNGVYDGYCLNPFQFIYPQSYGAQNSAGNAISSFNAIGYGSITQQQIDSINWLLSQNFTSDAKYGGQFSFGEVQYAIWRLVGYTDAQLASELSDPYLTANGRQSVSVSDANTLLANAQAAISSGHGVLPTNAYFSEIIDPDGAVQPLIIQLQTAKLGDYVWLDTNGNGIQNVGEVGVDNVVVELYNGAGQLIATTLTGDDFSTAAIEHGFYQFAGLAAGSYQVKFVAPSYQFTTQDALGNSQDATDSDANAMTGFSQIVTLAAGQSNQTVDAGLIVPPSAKISGFVYEDVGNDGLRNAEPAISGVSVTLSGINDLGAVVTAATVTNALGYYEFVGLRAGTYTVVETQPAGYLDGKDTAGTTGGSVATNDQISGIPLAPGQHSQENNFGELKPASLTGFVFNDTNNDGSRAGDVGIPGATVTITGTDDLGNPVTLTTTTAADGSYGFANLRQIGRAHV